MPPRYAATVSCPSCGTRFQAPIEQILDVRVDPSTKNRVLSGSVNVAVCPSCGTGGALNLPFIYHDPEREVALLYLPIDSGPTEVERQRVAGRLTRQLMDAMPLEERKGYLLQPETFISVESLVKRLFEIEGISEDDVARSQEQREFVAALLEAPQESWPEMVTERASLVDVGLFAFVEYILQLVSAGGQQSTDAAKVEALHEYLVNETEAGRKLAHRSEIVRRFAEDQSRDSLLGALIEAPDGETVQLLVGSGVQFMDYAFFQALNQRIEEATSTEAQQKLQTLRRSILDHRDELVKRGEDQLRDRAALLRGLALTDDPRKMANSHLSELDDLFFTVLGAQINEAQKAGDDATLGELNRVARAVNEVMESTMPPEIAITRNLMVAPSDEQLDKQLNSIRELLTPAFLQFLGALQESLTAQGQDEAAARVSKIQARAQQIAPAARAPEQAHVPEPSGRDAEPEPTTPSGLIIAKR